ncbi:hypothetical protein F503_06319 [Ophiostoma piceae UAMH 11346]|uniref:Uncharacterized protein n=1 Tax=Ophiostoma piceae (strain UAMH 11346) TaxID=1262450 RepID=S3CVI3_OPHP1|nr:hypothetical protein F503_06319 [Ophiostoma piceae UAMH 11346]
MQRRRQPSHPNTTSISTSTSQTSANPDYLSPSASAPIELRDRQRPVHGTSSSISGLYQRAPSAVTDSYLPPSSRVAYNPDDTIFIMKPVVSAIQAWSCFVISAFAILILSILGLLFKNNHHEMVGGIEDPENGPEVAATIFTAVLIYIVFLVFCGLQGMLHLRENRRGAIAL